MVASETLPLSGYGSEPWFDRVFNFNLELSNALKILSQGVGALPIIKYLEKQVTTHLTEWGAGQEALTIQPPTEYSIKNHAGIIEVYAQSCTEYGEQLRGYLNFADMPEVIASGMHAAFQTLLNLEPHEGIVIFSPTEFYQDRGSKSDVINPIMVTDTVKDSAGHPLEIRAKGWFLFPNRVLNSSERRLWLQCHTLEEIHGSDLLPQNIVQNPHFLPISSHETAPDSSDEIKDYVNWINAIFKDRFNKPLFTHQSDHEDSLRAALADKAKRNAPLLFHWLLRGEKIPFYQKIWELMHQGQQQWAELMDINFDDYWSGLLQGTLTVQGLHAVGGSNFSESFNPMMSSWIGGTYPTRSSEISKSHRCKQHGRYKGKACPKCKSAEV